MIGRVAGKRVILWVMTIARVSCWAGELLENVWFCELWLLSVWVTELASCRKTCDFVSSDYWACELLRGRVAGKRVILWVVTFERVSYWAGGVLEKYYFVSYDYWACELLIGWAVWKTFDFVSYDYWAYKLLSGWVVGKRVILWVMTIEHMSYWAGGLLENVWFCELWLFSVWVTERVSCWKQWRTQEFCSGWGVQQIQLRTEDRENGDLGAVAP